MAIAEHMGRTLQKTSVSTNIKERLDFSCALFDAGGNLVANAPHIPVHLGSMSHAVKYQLDQFGCSLRPGDVVLANHPQAGGSHLPDITVITPVFCAAGVNIIFFVASRAHHADIGGIAPGSMPPASRELFQEGAVTAGFKVVDAGEFQDAAVRRFLLDEPARFPGCSGSRNYRDVVSDLHAQIAANQRGITLVYQLCDERGLPIVQAYMRHIQRTAEAAVRSLLRDARARLIAGAGADADPDKPVRLAAADHMDDGSRISLAVEISADGSAVFDFSGTSPEVYANTNAPPSVTSSAIIYCLRCMVRSDLPLNQGCLAPVTIRIPPGSLLAPSPTAAVVGGNVLTSQRLCDVILTAFGAAAASQGCMNNLTFGVPPSAPDAADGWGYYETIAGGHGAGPTWDGQSGVHTHMTNTRITDPETLERRYPVILHRFSLRPGSGGRGARPGGDGCVRDIEFLAPMPVSLLTERRVFQPPGLHGGCSGARGVNLWRRRTAAGGYRVLNLGGKNTVHVSTGDRIVVMTPGGGGYGAPPHSDDTAKDDNSALFDDALAYCA
ncbi:5-oxoprolinase [Kickxella alabastrina]|uniref:5-oxoprolinase n=1 Tax=Kickxella alabastrina TaxID=61397 RepID=UPI00221FB51B|nr:5-oxoprolinase [Kickxella alabastrina]KAI7829151.1 5-oxoprolinase [Kickxella alabastrina]